ncbi:response regulator transcription factor [Ornithinimicrobium sp. Y1847]|uniref:response regulator transcription factor n=1 Tax=Ornithinimicrobium sp. Y1847 TaxID=3405419 RepID=UPI003B67186F
MTEEVSPARVLLAEDDPTISEPLARALRREGYEVQVAEDGRAALAGALGDVPPDLVILDLGLPQLDGLDVCRSIREGGVFVPVLMLTARSDEIDTVVGLDAGADDYVTKPFRLGELMARVRALLRRGPQTPVRRGDGALRMDVQARRVFLHDKEIRLTTKEFDLLRVLMREEGRVVAREVLMRDVWDSWFGSTKTLDMHVSVLRRKIGDDAHDPRYIVTVRGVGFRFQNDAEG